MPLASCRLTLETALWNVATVRVVWMVPGLVSTASDAGQDCCEFCVFGLTEVLTEKVSVKGVPVGNAVQASSNPGWTPPTQPPGPTMVPVILQIHSHSIPLMYQKCQADADRRTKRAHHLSMP